MDYPQIKVMNLNCKKLQIAIISTILLLSNTVEASSVLVNHTYEITAKINDVDSYKTMWTNRKAYMYASMNDDEESIDYLEWNNSIDVIQINKEWYLTLEDDNIHNFIKSEDLESEECENIITNIPNYSGFKSYMDYRAITDKNSPQYKLQAIAYTGLYGIRMIDDYFCVAVGTGTGAEVGDYGELILENNMIIPIIVSDIKNNQHTDSNNLITVVSDCCSEFIVDVNSLNKEGKKRGSVSYVNELWDSPVTQIKIYKHNYLED